MRDIILNMVNIHPAISQVDLSLKVMGEVNPVIFKVQEYWDELESLIRDGEVVVCEYALPQLPFKLNSLYFPKGTEVYGNYIDFTKESRILQRSNAEANSVS